MEPLGNDSKGSPADPFRDLPRRGTPQSRESAFRAGRDFRVQEIEFADVGRIPGVICSINDVS